MLKKSIILGLSLITQSFSMEKEHSSSSSDDFSFSHGFEYTLKSKKEIKKESKKIQINSEPEGPSLKRKVDCYTDDIKFPNEIIINKKQKICVVPEGEENLDEIEEIDNEITLVEMIVEKNPANEIDILEDLSGMYRMASRSRESVAYFEIQKFFSDERYKSIDEGVYYQSLINTINNKIPEIMTLFYPLKCSTEKNECLRELQTYIFLTKVCCDRLNSFLERKAIF